MNWLGILPLRSDPSLVEKVLSGQNMRTLSGIFVTHTHFDHCIDAPMVAKLTNAPLYASESMRNVAQAYKDPSIRIEALKPVRIGKFRVSMFTRVHSEILELFEFLPGKVPADFNFSFYDYKVGESWIYILEHPEGNILIDTSGDANLPILPKDIKIQAVFQGVANRKSNETLIHGYVQRLAPKKFIATHFDYFMLPFVPGPQRVMGNVDFPGLQEAFRKEAPGTEFIVPAFGTPIPLF